MICKEYLKDRGVKISQPEPDISVAQFKRLLKTFWFV